MHRVPSRASKSEKRSKNCQTWKASRFYALMARYSRTCPFNNRRSRVFEGSFRRKWRSRGDAEKFPRTTSPWTQRKTEYRVYGELGWNIVRLGTRAPTSTVNLSLLSPLSVDPFPDQLTTFQRNRRNNRAKESDDTTKEEEEEEEKKKEKQ